jgi:nitrilase
MLRLAVVQKPPAFLDRDQTLRNATASVAEAAAAGAQLVVFPEAFVPGYPAWIWRLRPGTDMGTSSKLHALLLENAVDLDRGDLAPLCEAARTHEVSVVCGINERDGQFSRGTLYNTLVIIGPDGTLHNRHRKLMPTNPERMVWGFGDGSGLNVVEIRGTRIGGLICWENLMPLARYALFAQGIDIYIAPTYDCGEGWIGSLQHIAREGGCWVVGSGTLLRASDLPAGIADWTSMYPDPNEWINPGDSVVIAPRGKIVAGPLHEQAGILYADIDPAQAGIARRALDVTGHYSRPDVFQLHINRQAQAPVKFE